MTTPDRTSGSSLMKTAIIDYGMCNLDSVARAVYECGHSTLFVKNAIELAECDSIILPGVGSFAEGMKNIRKLGLDIAIKNEVLSNRIPILGICLGMQLLSEKGSEGGETDGLGLIQGEVIRLKPKNPDEKIPHIGWNEVNQNKDSLIFEGIASGKDFYFAHSYHFICRDPGDILAKTPYCGGFISAVSKGTVFGVQFHPEKSLGLGLKLLSNFLSIHGGL
jgi:imidazole glycerol-phosphate synthase subunit HisH